MPVANRNPKNKTITVSYRYLPLWILMAVVVFLLFAFLTGSRSVFRLYDLYQQRTELLLEKQALEAENQKLQEQIEKLQHDLEYIEKIARERYNLKREDEDIYKILPEVPEKQE